MAAQLRGRVGRKDEDGGELPVEDLQRRPPGDPPQPSSTCRYRTPGRSVFKLD
jgi:hypothetical protein